MSAASQSRRVEYLRAGTVVGGRYELVRALGEGGMGTVYEAVHTALGRRVAVKILHSELTRDKTLAKRFLREARTASEVRHKNVVEVLDFGTEEDRCYLVMEFLQGESLDQWIRREAPSSPAAVFPWFDCIARALSVLHEKGVVHRDIKPENIFLARSEETPDAPAVPKLLDFGIAKRASGEQDLRLTATGTAMGTPAYMAPEQAGGARDVGAAADQYALACVLFEALANDAPHYADNYNALIIAKVTTPAETLHTLRPDLPMALSELLQRALATNPSARFASVEEFRKAFEAFAALTDKGHPRARRPRAPVIEQSAERPSAIPTQPQRALPAPAVPKDFEQEDEQSQDPASQPTLPERPTPRGIAAETIDLKARTPKPVQNTKPPEDVPAAIANPTLPESATPKQRTSPVWFLPVLALLIVPAVFFARPAPTVPVQQSVQTTPASAPTTTLQFIVEAPNNAVIELDGVEIGVGRAAVLRPRDESTHAVRVSAPGYVTQTNVVRADRNQVLTMRLVPHVTAVDVQIVPSTATTTPVRPAAVVRPTRPTGTGRNPGLQMQILTDLPGAR